jgi:hypothetical protein
MWPVSGSYRYGVCASLLVAHLHCYIIPVIRQYPKDKDNFRVADLHVSLLSRRKKSPDARYGGARTYSACQNPQLARVPLGEGSCLRRTGHPFTVSDPCGPSQKIECVYSASPETIRREPREFAVRRSVGNRRTWQSARCVILLFFAQRAAVLCRRALGICEGYEVALPAIHGEQIRHHLPSYG